MTQSQTDYDEFQHYLPNSPDTNNKLSNPTSPSDSDVNALENTSLQEENNEEYLRSIWNLLGVGKDGYLNVDELMRVCEHIGMIETSDEMIQQLFEKLDYDQDGRVSFDEFLQGLFQHGSNTASNDNNVNLTPLQSSQESPIHNNNSITHGHQLNRPETNTNEVDDLLMDHNSSFYSNSYLITLDADKNG